MTQTPKQPLQAVENKSTPRRTVLKYGLTALMASMFHERSMATPTPVQNQQVAIDLYSAAGAFDKQVQKPKIIKTDSDWRQQLSVQAYKVARRAGTERPFSGSYWNNHADGLYRCICCDTALFDSKTKFESGTGWPSFWQAISPLNVVKSSDRSFGMQRDAISCALCDAHLGHVFNDGPKPTGLRYCMNSVSLHFAPRA